MIHKPSLVAGAGAAVAARAALPHLLLLKLRRDVRQLNAGNYQPLLAGYHDDAILRFNVGAHRWSGPHRGKAAIDRFLRDFTHAGLQGELRSLWLGGPPWALTLIARFDDHATGPGGEQLYANRVAMVIRTRWGRIVEHEDFFEDTGRILALEEKLRGLGIEPVAVTEDTDRGRAGTEDTDRARAGTEDSDRARAGAEHREPVAAAWTEGPVTDVAPGRPLDAA